MNLKVKELDVPYAFHSSQMDSFFNGLEKAAEGVHFRAPQILMASTLLGRIIESSGSFSASYMIRQTWEPVDFLGAVHTASITHPHAPWIEDGPDATCVPAI